MHLSKVVVTRVALDDEARFLQLESANLRSERLTNSQEKPTIQMPKTVLNVNEKDGSLNFIETEIG